MSPEIQIELETSCDEFCNLSWSFAVITTFAPFSAKIFAVANPIPLLAPVTNATFSANFIIFRHEFVIYRSML